jgi:DNA-binding NarL/FixJ family response regulator
VIRVALVDDQELVRAGFKMVLDAQPDMTVTAEAADGEAAVRLAARGGADVMVMDVRMPRLDGVTAARQICAAGPLPRVLMLTTFDLDEYAFAALKAGASGFLLKDVPPAELLFAIRSVHSGDSVVAPSTTRRLLMRFAPMLSGSGDGDPGGRDPAEANKRLADLTEREREVLIQVAAGLSNAEIAGRLYVSEATVKTHVGRILAKLGLRDRVQAVVLAYETGLVRAQNLCRGRSAAAMVRAGALPAGSGDAGAGACAGVIATEHVPAPPDIPANIVIPYFSLSPAMPADARAVARAEAVARCTAQARAARAHSGRSHQAFTFATCASSAVTASPSTTITATCQSSPMMKSYQNIPNDLRRLMS